LVGDWQSTTRNAFTENRAHNAAHELTAISSVPLTYDARGNLLTDDIGHSLTWDFDNQIRTHILSENGSGASYLYDVLGRKVGRTVGSTTTIFVHSGQEVAAEYDNGSLRVKYILGPSIDRPIAYTAAGNVYWYFANNVGTIAAISDSAGTVLERYRYDAYGERTVLSPTGSVRAGSYVDNQIGFTGRYHDGATGLVDFRFRQYDARMGRFISRDDEYRDGMLLYAAHFVPNSTDPTGHLSVDPTCMRDIYGNCVQQGFRRTPAEQVRDEIRTGLQDGGGGGGGGLVGLAIGGGIGLGTAILCKLFCHHGGAGGGGGGMPGGNPPPTPAPDPNRPLSNAAIAAGYDNISWNKLNQQEKSFVERHPFVARRFREAAMNANDETQRRWRGNPERFVSGPENAFQHAYWNALMARSDGESLAKEAADAHESSPNNVASDKWMDLWNNSVGRELQRDGEKAGESLPDHVYRTIIEQKRGRWIEGQGATPPGVDGRPNQ
jgi:RHS repeat-associated protein